MSVEAAEDSSSRAAVKHSIRSTAIYTQQHQHIDYLQCFFAFWRWLQKGNWLWSRQGEWDFITVVAVKHSLGLVERHSCIAAVTKSLNVKQRAHTTQPSRDCQARCRLCELREFDPNEFFMTPTTWGLSHGARVSHCNRRSLFGKWSSAHQVDGLISRV